MPLMQTFDALVCDESRPQREASITPLQALAMLNGDFVNEEAAHFADRIEQSGQLDLVKQIELAFEIALSRLPSEHETKHMMGLIKSSSSVREGLVSLCRVLLNANEFLYVD